MLRHLSSSGNCVIVFCKRISFILMLVISFFFRLFYKVPETPYWLLTKRRDKEALQSLQWLRGWVPERTVRQEFADISEFVRKTFSCKECRRDSKECFHDSEYWTRFLEIAHRSSMRPFLLIGFSFVVTHLCGMTAVRPFRVQLFKVFGLPCETSWMTVYLIFLSKQILLKLFLCVVLSWNN